MAIKNALRSCATKILTSGPKGNSAGRNSQGRITSFHRGGGAKRLLRKIDLKRNSSSMGIVERIEYDPNRSSRIALVRWKVGDHQRKCTTSEDFVPPKKILESTTTTTIRGPFAFSSLPEKVDRRKVVSFSPGLKAVSGMVQLPTKNPKSQLFTSDKVAGSKLTSAKDVFSSAFSSSKAKEETASVSFGKSFPRIVVAGAKAPFFVFGTNEEVRGKDTFSLSEIRKWKSDSILWGHRIKRKAALSWQSFKREENLGLLGASDHNKSKQKMDQGFYTKGLKNVTSKYERAPITYILATHQMEAGKMVMNCHSSKPSLTSNL